MSGTIEGGKLAAKKNKELYGNNFYHEIGRKGGQASGTGGFYANPDLASIVGKIGGQRSSRKGQKTSLEARKRMSIAQKARWARIKSADSYLMVDYGFKQPIITQRKVSRFKWW